MKMQPKKRQPTAQRTTKSVVTVKRRSKFEDEEEEKSDVEEKQQLPSSPVNETIGLNFSSINLIVNHKHKNNKEKEKAKQLSKPATTKKVDEEKIVQEREGTEGTDLDDYGQLFDSQGGKIQRSAHST